MLSYENALKAINEATYGYENRMPIRDALMQELSAIKASKLNAEELEKRIIALESAVPSDDEPPMKEFALSFFDSKDYVIGEDYWKDSFGETNIRMYNTQYIVADPDPSRASWIQFQDIDASTSNPIHPGGVWNSPNADGFNPLANAYTAYIVASDANAYAKYTYNTILSVSTFAINGGEARARYDPAIFKDTFLGVSDSGGNFARPSNTADYVLTENPHVYCMTIYDSPSNASNYEISAYVDGEFYVKAPQGSKTKIFTRTFGIHHNANLSSSDGSGVGIDGTRGHLSVRAIMFYKNVQTASEIKTISEWLATNYMNT